MKRIAVVLSGCGVLDGAEIHESVLALLHLQKAGAEVHCVAPNKAVSEVMDHLHAVPSKESRNVLIEAARIARGQIQSLSDVTAEKFDGAILPGGFGAAKNLCDFAVKGEAFEIDPVVARFLKGFIDANKPLGFLCIAPVMIAKLYPKGVQMTIGNDQTIVEQLTRLGVEHRACSAEEIVADERYKVVSTPAYMLAKHLVEAEQGISRLVNQLLLWA